MSNSKSWLKVLFHSFTLSLSHACRLLLLKSSSLTSLLLPRVSSYQDNSPRRKLPIHRIDSQSCKRHQRESEHTASQISSLATYNFNSSCHPSSCLLSIGRGCLHQLDDSVPFAAIQRNSFLRQFRNSTSSEIYGTFNSACATRRRNPFCV